MKVLVTRSFVARAGGQTYRGVEGEEVELPRALVKQVSAFVQPLRETAALAGGKPRVAGPGNDPVTEISGIGPKTAGALREYGVTTIADLAAADVPEEFAGFQEAARELLRG